ncbi:hypothetical protein Dimus_010817 [Dionaea muscipula]
MVERVMMEEPIPVGVEHRPDLTSSVEVRGSIDGFRPNLNFSPRLGDELMPVDEEQGLPATILQEGEDSIGGPDSMLGADLVAPGSIDGVSAMDNLLKIPVEVGLDGEGEPEHSPAAAAFRHRVTGLGLTAAGGANPVVAGDVDDGEFQAYASSIGSFPLSCRSTSLPVHDLAVEQGIADDLLCWATVPVSSSSSIANLPADAAVPGCGMVSEEVAVSPVVGVALRPQPTDGLRQPPLSPVGSALVIESEPGVLSGDAQAPVELVVVVQSGPGVLSAAG